MNVQTCPTNPWRHVAHTYWRTRWWFLLFVALNALVVALLPGVHGLAVAAGVPLGILLSDPFVWGPYPARAYWNAIWRRARSR